MGKRIRRKRDELKNTFSQFKCEHCDKYYVAQGVLNLHYQSKKHKATLKEKRIREDESKQTKGQYKCKQCKKYYVRKGDLNNHKKKQHSLKKKEEEEQEEIEEEEQDDDNDIQEDVEDENEESDGEEEEEYESDGEEENESDGDIEGQEQIPQVKEKQKRKTKYKNYFIDTQGDTYKTFFTEIMNDQKCKDILLLIGKMQWVCQPYEFQEQVNIYDIIECIQFCNNYYRKNQFPEFGAAITEKTLKLDYLEKNEDEEIIVDFSEINKFSEFIIKMKYLSFYFKSDIKKNLVFFIIFLKFCLDQELYSQDCLNHIFNEYNFQKMNITIEFLSQMISIITKEYKSPLEELEINNQQ